MAPEIHIPKWIQEIMDERDKNQNFASSLAKKTGSSVKFATEIQGPGVLKIATVEGQEVSDEVAPGKVKKRRDKASQVIDQTTGDVKVLPQGGEIRAGQTISIRQFASQAGLDSQTDAKKALNKVRKRRRSAKKGK